MSKIKCRILAIDLRGHGETHTSDDNNLSIECMVSDIVSIINKLYSESDPIVVIGHSMGGACAVRCAKQLNNVVSLTVIDVVEGTALESLASMQSFLRSRPSHFPSVERAINWCLRSGQTQNLDAAKVSMPGQIKNIKTGMLAASEVSSSKTKTESTDTKPGSSNVPRKFSAPQVFKRPIAAPPTIGEEGDCCEPADNSDHSYTWRINLSNTEVYWRDWFSGLSQEFLDSPVPKLLLLANIHGLDTALTVGQMQGKFQMQVLPRCGHAIHEDLPEKVAEVIALFLIRHKLADCADNFTPKFSFPLLN